MADAKFTPGPWAADLGEVYRVRDADGAGVAMCQHVHLSGRRGSDEVVANANLIAAAPDLFAALEAMLAANQPQVVHRVYAGEAQELAMAALAKARGEQVSA